jgi:hypothetical protein
VDFPEPDSTCGGSPQLWDTRTEAFICPFYWEQIMLIIAIAVGGGETAQKAG